MKRPPRQIAFYITSHGLGHATRSSAIIRELFRATQGREPGLRVDVVGELPAWVFDELAPWRASIRFRKKRCDFVLAQKDGVRIDYEATDLILADYLCGIDAQAGEEAAYLRAEGIDLVLSDIPAVPFAAAASAGIPSIGISNFGWDYIYRAYADRSRRFAEAAARFAEAYANASLLLRLPFSPQMEVFPRREDVPLVVRHARKSAQEIRAELGLAADRRPIALLSFGGFGLTDFDAGDLAAHDRFIFIAFGISARSVPAHVLMIPDGRCYFPDLVRASSVIVSKPGYSIVSEAVAHQRAFLYAPRDDFAEAPHLVRGLTAHVPARRIELADFASCAFIDALDALIASDDYHPLGRTDGASVAAARILTSLP
jgi:L-arabinokinase